MELRFVIINVLPPRLADEVEDLCREIGQAVNSREALRYPPHLTLRTGIVIPDDQAAAIAGDFLAHASQASAIEVKSTGLFFQSYGDPPRGMAGWAIDPTPELLAFHQHLLQFREGQKGPQGPYQPHVSLAYHDLSLAGLAEVERRLTQPTAHVPVLQWTLDHVALFHEEGGSWHEWDRAHLRSSELS